MPEVTATAFRLRDVALTAYAPPLVAAIGFGAVTPVLALRARDLGAGVSVSALVVAVMFVGALISALPSGALIARIGERSTLVGAGAVDAVAMAIAGLTGSVVVLAGAVLLSGMAWTAFLIARQGYMIDVVPITHRARALATLGGMHRIGLVVGPLIGAATISVVGLRAVFLVAATFSAIAALLALLIPDVGSGARAAEREAGQPGVAEVLVAHRRTWATLGTSVVVISASRAIRVSLLPLWADHVGLSASATSLVFAVAGAVDVLFFYPGGWLMDHRGRFVTALAVVGSAALGALLLPVATSIAGVTVVMVLIAVGNGLGAGIVMTLGADAAPTAGRSQFLGGWRLCSELGNTGAPILVAGLAAVLPLAGACVVIGGLGVLGTAWVGRWTCAADRARLARSP